MDSKNKLFLVLITGPMGAGKTTVAKILHSKLKRTAHLGLDHIKKFISDFKRNPFDNEISRNVLAVMTSEYLRQNINVILEQGMKKADIESFKKMARKYKATFIVFELEAPKELLNDRVLKRSQPLGKFKVSKARINRNYHLYLKNRYEDAIILNSEKLSPEQIAKGILKQIKG